MLNNKQYPMGINKTINIYSNKNGNIQEVLIIKVMLHMTCDVI